VLEEVEVDVKLALELAFKTAFEFAFELPPVGEELPELLDIVIPNAGNLCYSYIITFRFSYNGPPLSVASSEVVSLAALTSLKKHSESQLPFVTRPWWCRLAQPYTVSTILPLQAFDSSQG
jgi:hypothetical protein